MFGDRSLEGKKGLESKVDLDGIFSWRKGMGWRKQVCKDKSVLKSSAGTSRVGSPSVLWIIWERPKVVVCIVHPQP